MDRNALIQRLMATFLAELREHAQMLEQGLLALEQTSEPSDEAELTKALLRAAHSLKGAARSVDVGTIEAVCHQLEEVFSSVRDGRLKLDGGAFRTLLEAADSIREAGVLLEQGKDAAGGPLSAVVPRLIQIAGRGTAAAEPGERRVESRPAARPAASAGAPARSNAPDSKGQQVGFRQERHVRLTAAKLDQLLTESTGLLLTQNRLEARLERLEVLRESCRQMRSRYPRTPGRVKEAEGEAGSLTRSRRRRMQTAFSEITASNLLARCRSDLGLLERELEELLKGFREDCRELQRSVSGLDVEVHRARMVPFSEACDGLSRMIRDLSDQQGKLAHLTIKGGDIQIDRAIAELLRDPLRHLVRNAVDHGLEARETRREAGKPESGEIVIQAALRGARLEIMVADDGRGLALSAIQDRVAALHAGSEEARDPVYHIFTPGFSTASGVTEISGRGIGLDVVKTQVEAMRGAVDLAWELGSGTQFTLSIPLTLAKIRALLVEVGGQIFAIDTAGIRQVVRVEQSELQVLEGRPTLLRGARSIPVSRLSGLLALSSGSPDSVQNNLLCVILAAGSREAALVVDDLVGGERELVTKSIGPRLAALRQYSGGTVLPDGTATLILNSAHLVDAACTRSLDQPPWAIVEQGLSRRPHILVADDSVTTRAMEQSILESAGYTVTAAADGAEAWRLLQERGADLLIADIEMPRMDGFSLAETVRKSDRFLDLPIILVTARESEEDRTRGVHAGANAYIGKSGFDQQSLLETISQLL